MTSPASKEGGEKQMQYNPKEQLIQKYENELNGYIKRLRGDIQKIRASSLEFAVMHWMIRTIEGAYKIEGHQIPITMDRYQKLLDDDIKLYILCRLMLEESCDILDTKFFVYLLNTITSDHQHSSGHMYFVSDEYSLQIELNQIAPLIEKEEFNPFDHAKKADS